MSKFKIGTKVVLRKDSFYYKNTSQGIDDKGNRIVGTIVRHPISTFDYKVEWEDGITYSYNDYDLELVNTRPLKYYLDELQDDTKCR